MGSCQGRSRTGGVHLDPGQLPTSLHPRAGNEAQRSSVELPLLSGFGFQFVLARLRQCFRTVCLYHSRSFTEVHGSALRTLAFLKVLLATTTLTRLLSALSRGPLPAWTKDGSACWQSWRGFSLPVTSRRRKTCSTTVGARGLRLWLPLPCSVQRIMRKIDNVFSS